MPSINVETRNYMEIRVNKLLLESSRKYQEKHRLIRDEFENLTKQLKNHLPKIKGVFIDVSLETKTPYKSTHSYKHDLIDESMIEFQLDKSKRTKEWLDNRIIEISAKCMDYQDELLINYRKELSLARRRVNRFIRSR